MGFLAALHFLTTVPAATRRHFSDAQLGASLAYYPLVGALLGVVLAIVARLLAVVFEHSMVTALTVLAWVLLTGGLHLDGFMDACDGLFAHRSTEERLRVMRDVHVGAWGVIGVVLLLLLKVAALTTLLERANATGALLLAPTLARWAMCVSVGAFPYGRAEGWGKTLKENASPRAVWLATLSTLVIAGLVQPLMGLLSLGLAVGTMLLVTRFALDRLPGLTGDVYGMIAEISEVVVLVAFTVQWP